MATNAQTLIPGTECIISCIPVGYQMAALIRQFASLAGVTLDANGIQALLDQAKCINSCIPRGYQMAALISLMSQISSGTPAPPVQTIQFLTQSPNPANAVIGDTITITGIGFDPIQAAYMSSVAYDGGTHHAVTYINSTTIQITVGTGIAGAGTFVFNYVYNAGTITNAIGLVFHT